MTTATPAPDLFELQPITEPGRRFVALCEAHAADFATRADQHDRENSFPFENFAALTTSGTLAATVPEELGGLGVVSVHDYALGLSRLGRGDGATAIATNMHLSLVWVTARAWRAARAAGEDARADGLERRLRAVGMGELVLCIIVSEPGTDVFHPLTEATRTAGGWRITGHKIFGTLSPLAHLITTSVRVPDGAGGFRRAVALVPRDAPGVEIKDNWDALGMRASGSHDVVFRECFVPEEALTLGGPWGQPDETSLVAHVAGHLGLAAVSLGIAEAARDHIVHLVSTRRKGPSGRTLAERTAIQHTIAEIEIDLAAARATLGRGGLTADAFLAAHPPGTTPLEEAHAFFKDLQCTRMVVLRRAIDIVDRALTASGGAGYLNKSPLSRWYRDVRAGLFQPLSPNEAYEYIGQVTLGLDPVIDA